MVVEEGKNIEITGGNILALGKDSNISTTPKQGTNNLYVTPIRLQNVEGNKKIESIEIGNSTSYNIKDMYTLSNYEGTNNFDETGMIYLYLPLGEKTINIKVDGNTYSGTVNTQDGMEVVTLTKTN